MPNVFSRKLVMVPLRPQSMIHAYAPMNGALIELTRIRI